MPTATLEPSPGYVEDLLAGYLEYTTTEDLAAAQGASEPGNVAAGCFCSLSVFPSYTHG